MFLFAKKLLRPLNNQTEKDLVPREMSIVGVRSIRTVELLKWALEDFKCIWLTTFDCGSHSNSSDVREGIVVSLPLVISLWVFDGWMDGRAAGIPAKQFWMNYNKILKRRIQKEKSMIFINFFSFFYFGGEVRIGEGVWVGGIFFGGRGGEGEWNEKETKTSV